VVGATTWSESYLLFSPSFCPRLSTGRAREGMGI